jgi:hypothetical protein
MNSWIRLSDQGSCRHCAAAFCQSGHEHGYADRGAVGAKGSAACAEPVEGVGGNPVFRLFRPAATAVETLLPLADVDAVISYCHYSLNDTSLFDLLPLIGQKQTGLVNASPLSMGLLGTRGTPPWHPADEELKRICRRAADYCAEQGADIAKLAVQFSTSNPDIPPVRNRTWNSGRPEYKRGANR